MLSQMYRHLSALIPECHYRSSLQSLHVGGYPHKLKMTGVRY